MEVDIKEINTFHFHKEVLLWHMLFLMTASSADHVKASARQALSMKAMASLRSIRIPVWIAVPVSQFARQALSARNNLTNIF